jgi:hypothetical protein
MMTTKPYTQTIHKTQRAAVWEAVRVARHVATPALPVLKEEGERWMEPYRLTRTGWSPIGLAEFRRLSARPHVRVTFLGLGQPEYAVSVDRGSQRA